MPKKSSKTIVRSIRLPSILWEALERCADKNRRSIASELILWIETARDSMDK